MATLTDPRLCDLRLCDLRDFRGADLDVLLREETREWQDSLDWDFEKSADLVRKFVNSGSLNGKALVNGREVVGYSYYILEEHKGMIGDLYVREEFRSPAWEQGLLGGVLREMRETPYLERIEGQLMLLGSALPKPVPLPGYFQCYLRDFLSLDLTRAIPAAPRGLPKPMVIQPWQDAHQEDAAQLIAATYSGHVDSLINDQYRSAAGARRFLYNIVQYPGCGTFYRGASLSSFDKPSGLLNGICLASLVSADAGHVTQICVGKRFQGIGLGYELLRRTIELLRQLGCRTVSLTVTGENRCALDLYRGLGFQPVRRFAAYVWEGW